MSFLSNFWGYLFGQKIVIDGKSMRIKRSKDSITLYTSSGIMHLGNSNTGSVRQGNMLIEFDLFINGEKYR